MKRYWPQTMIVTGLLVVAVGFFYNVLYAGIPYQDPTPEMTARYNFHWDVSTAICLFGLSTTFVGAICLSSRTLRRIRAGDQTPR